MKLTWETTHCLLLVGALLRQPQIVEPLDNFNLQMIRHPPHPHVSLHAVQLRCNHQLLTQLECTILNDNEITIIYKCL